MADDAQSIRSLNWRELFPFLNIFRSFGIAMHPSKLLLGFALLFLVYAGGRVLDWIWPAIHYAAPSEIDGYEQYRWSYDRTGSFEDERDNFREKNAQAYAQHLIEFKIVTDGDAALEAARRGKYHSDLQGHIVFVRNTKLDALQKEHDDAIKASTTQRDEGLKSVEDRRKDLRARHDAHGLNDKDFNDAMDDASKRERDVKAAYATAERTANENLENSPRKIRAEALANIADLNSKTPKPLFDSFFEYEVQQFHHVMDSALTWNWFNGIARGAKPVEGTPAVGVVRSLANLAVVGPCWLLRYHFIYFILFAAWFLIVWAIFGGAIARIAAVHVARDEKISVTQAVRFSFSKVLSFVFAPLIPLIIILVTGVLVGVGGMLLYIPWLGPILVGALFILALVAGFVMTLVATGTVGGFNLMYPTIAVEGSDSFDAISRSFSYVFGRPWKKLFYSAVAIVYGALCFLFARYFIYVMLSFTHFFVHWFLGGKASLYWPEIWPPVSDENLAYQINFQALKWSDATGAFLIALWVYSVLTLLGGFVISFYFSANTIIYYLMRREVDATEMDDVYVEETEDDFTEAAAATTTPAPATTPTATPVASPAAEAPPAASPASEATPPPA